tara:strand:+ start:598 stop:786 length:189 start_codon:yes stop_codon:yes gene_type:complete
MVGASSINKKDGLQLRTLIYFVIVWIIGAGTNKNSFRDRILNSSHWKDLTEKFSRKGALKSQ